MKQTALFIIAAILCVFTFGCNPSVPGSGGIIVSARKPPKQYFAMGYKMNVYRPDGTKVVEGVEPDENFGIKFTVPEAGTYVCRMHYDLPVIWGHVTSICDVMESFLVDVHADGRCHFTGIDAYFSMMGRVADPMELDKPSFLLSSRRYSGSYCPSSYGAPDVYVEYSYDSLNRLLQEKAYLGGDAGGTLYGTTSYFYNADGLVSMSVTDAADNSKDSCTVYAYSGKRITEMTNCSGLVPGGTVMESWKYEYNASGKLISSRYYVCDGNLSHGIYTENSITYDSNGGLSSITLYRGVSLNGSDKGLVSCITPSYDSGGNIISYSADAPAAGQDGRYDFILNQYHLPLMCDIYKGELGGSMTKILTHAYSYEGSFDLLKVHQAGDGSLTYGYGAGWAQTSIIETGAMNRYSAFNYGPDGNFYTCEVYTGKTSPAGTPDGTITHAWTDAH